MVSRAITYRLYLFLQATLVSHLAKLAKRAATVRHRAAFALQAPPAPKHHSSLELLSASVSRVTWARTAGASARVDDSASAARSSAPKAQVNNAFPQLNFIMGKQLQKISENIYKKKYCLKWIFWGTNKLKSRVIATSSHNLVRQKKI